MNNNIDFLSQLKRDPMTERMMRESNNALKRIFGKYIKESFLIEMKDKVMISFPQLVMFYDVQLNPETWVKGLSGFNFEHDICRFIVGCHCSNTIFLSDEERAKLQRSSEYKSELAEQVIQHIKLRRFGSEFFRIKPFMHNELFINYSVPYNLYVMAIFINAGVHQPDTNTAFYNLYKAILEKSLAALTLLEVSLFDNCYPICRAIIELYFKLFLSKVHPHLLVEFEKFKHFEVIQSCCEQKYPEDFNELFEGRTIQTKQKKIDYLHYGWVDTIPEYHDIVKKHPYSINGILTYLKTLDAEDNYHFADIEIYYKMCHGYAHGNIGSTKYPLLHYFEISIILHCTLFPTFKLFCQEMQLDGQINGVDLFAKEEKDFLVLLDQYLQRSTENFEAHYHRLQYK